MIRQLIEAFAFEIRMLKLGHALSKTDDAASARDTALLESVQRRRVTVPADCPLPDCSACPSLDVAAEEQRAREIAALAYRLRTEFPEMWNDTPWPELEQIAAWILAIRADVAAGKWGRG
jgi:hypothetical protein